MQRSTIVGALCLCAGFAHADVLYGYADITASGQQFVFHFTDIGASIGAGTLTVEALGDYSVVPPSSETMTWDLDGVVSGVGFNAEAFSGPVDLFQNHVLQSWTISEADMASITADGMLTITLTNANAVNYTPGAGDWISVTLDYPVPAPAGALVLGAAGLVTARRRR